MNIEPADIVGIPFPYTDMSTRKRRPVLALTSPDSRGDFICLPVTSVQTEELAICIEEKSLETGKLPKTSWVRYDKVFTLNTSLMKNKYASLGADIFYEVLSSSCRHLNCS